MPIKWFVAVTLIVSLLNAEKYTLDVLCKKGIENNPKIKSFAHKTSASHSYYKQSIDRYKPQVTIDGHIGYQDYQYEQSDGIVNFYGLSNNYRISLKQSIYSATLLRSMTDAKEREKLAQLVEEDEKAKLITMILQSSFELMKLGKTIEILTKKEQLLEKAYANIQKKHKLKLASQVDKYQALSRLQESRSSLVKAKQIYNHNLFNLKLLTKLDQVEKYIKPLNFNIHAIMKAFKKTSFTALKTLFQNNTRIKLDKQTVMIAKGQIELRESERYPTFDAMVSYGDVGGTIDQVTRQNESRAMVMLNFPIYQGGYVSDRAEEAQFLYYAAQEDAENTQMNIKISLEKAFHDIGSGLESFKADKLAVKASKKYLDATIKSYTNGLGNLTDAYLSEADYHDNRLRLINTKASIFVSLAEIYYFSGMSEYEDIYEMQTKYLK